VLPFLAVYTGRVVNLPSQFKYIGPRVSRWVIILSLGATAAASVITYPDYLAYFNGIVRPADGYKVLVDSNLDWGQDLPGLSQWMHSNGVNKVYLSWFGVAPPEHYGVRYQYLPGWPPFENKALRVYHPQRPLPGVYAISATNLQGILLDDHDTFALFRNMPPVDQIGHSILIFQIPPLGPSQNLALGNVRFDQIPSEVLDKYFSTNDLHLRWFDPRTSLVLMNENTDSGICYAFSQATPLADLLTQVIPLEPLPAPGEPKLLFYKCPESIAVAAALSQVASVPVYGKPTDSQEIGESPLRVPVHFGSTLDFLGYALSFPIRAGDNSMTLVTYWRAQGHPAGPLHIFVHLVNSQGSIVSQYDGLDIPPAGWYKGDVLVQLHSLPFPAGPSAEGYWLWVGLYNPQTMERVPATDSEGTPIGTYILLPTAPTH